MHRIHTTLHIILGSIPGGSDNVALAVKYMYMKSNEWSQKDQEFDNKYRIPLIIIIKIKCLHTNVLLLLKR